VPVTREDVARLAGVSTTTVSYVVNSGPRPVSKETRLRVLQAVDQLRYQPSTIAQSLKTNRTHTVGILISDILNPILAAIAKNAQDLLLQLDYSLILCDSDESPDRELIWLRMLHRRRVDGIILLPTGANQSSIYAMKESGQHIVLIDRQVEGLGDDCVMFENERGAYDAVRHLISLGHSRIGMLNLKTSLTPGRERGDGYTRALREAGLPVLPELVREGGYKGLDGCDLAASLLDVDPPPTALFASSSRLALCALQDIKRRGLHMPDDVALCAFDDIPFYTLVTPSITAVSYDTQDFARQTVQFLIQRINSAYVGGARSARISCPLQVRESTIGLSAIQPTQQLSIARV
jgi:LacI family transcriptional regulator